MTDLSNIVLKAADNDESALIQFKLEGTHEVIETTSADSFPDARLPKDINRISFSARSWRNAKNIAVEIWDIGSAFFTGSTIEVSGQDTDWVSARTKELEDFISENKNFHWFFQNGIYVIIQALILSSLLGFILRENLAFFLIAYLSGIAYLVVVRKVFPAVVLNTGRSSTLQNVRRFLIFAIPVIFLSLLANLFAKIIFD